MISAQKTLLRSFVDKHKIGNIIFFFITFRIFRAHLRQNMVLCNARRFVAACCFMQPNQNKWSTMNKKICAFFTVQCTKHHALYHCALLWTCFLKACWETLTMNGTRVHQCIYHMSPCTTASYHNKIGVNGPLNIFWKFLCYSILTIYWYLQNNSFGIHNKSFFQALITFRGPYTSLIGG